jgi:hypothetical protein
MKNILNALTKIVEEVIEVQNFQDVYSFAASQGASMDNRFEMCLLVMYVTNFRPDLMINLWWAAWMDIIEMYHFNEP